MRKSTLRRTKILCTLGPAVAGVDNLLRLIYSGMDAARFNFSHGSHEYHLQMMTELREAAAIAKKPVPILMDLQGPKIRTGKVENGEVFLSDGDEFIITIEEIGIGNSKRVSTNYENLVKEVQARNTILLDDGYIILQAEKIENNDIITRVVKGGLLKDNKGIIVPGASSSAPSLSQKDLEDLKFGLDNGVDAVALSFVRSKRDILELKAAMKIIGREVPIIAKIERQEAVENIEEILEETTGVMVARGDLGLELPAEKVPLIQKEIIDKCNSRGIPVITATQMLESMIMNPRPTRAEASDVANAVLDGSDCVMLSGETSVGKYPFEAVGFMERIIRNTEEKYPFNNQKYKTHLNPGNEQISDALGKAACVISSEINAGAIVTLTSSTFTPKNVAGFRPKVPIIAVTDNEHVCRRLNFVWGVYPIYNAEILNFEEAYSKIRDLVGTVGFVAEDDLLVFVTGLSSKKVSPQNMIRIMKL